MANSFAAPQYKFYCRSKICDEIYLLPEMIHHTAHTFCENTKKINIDM